MSTYYQQLGILPGATQDELAAAYERQRTRYNPERLAGMDEEMSRLATQRLAELDRVYAILADPQRRQQYDASIGLAPSEVNVAAPIARRSLSSRERWYALGGGLAALLLIASIWMLTGRNDTPQSSPMAQVNRPAQPIELPTLDGGTINLADYRGQVVLLNFWGTWCEPCRRELPALQQAYTELR
nr:redoxin domain-containing protein [Chloroflexaceae bacterium]